MSTPATSGNLRGASAGGSPTTNTSAPASLTVALGRTLLPSDVPMPSDARLATAEAAVTYALEIVVHHQHGDYPGTLAGLRAANVTVAGVELMTRADAARAEALLTVSD